jgi:hypothetical protein
MSTGKNVLHKCIFVFLQATKESPAIYCFYGSKTAGDFLMPGE